jgi:hypothetical protein
MSASTFAATDLAPPPTPAPWPERLDRILGPVMFYLALTSLIVAAGVIHRVSHGDLSALEAELLRWGMLLLWPVFVLEGWLRLRICRRPQQSRARRLWGFFAVAMLPPLRLAGRAYADPSKIWLPGWGWTTVDQRLRNRLERLISGPMMIVALLVLPFLAIEYFWLETVRAHFGLSLALDIGTAVIWLAFALEFIVMASLAEDRIGYCLGHWLDFAVVILPLIDFLPILRLLRLGSVLEVQQVSRLGRLYRLKSLAARFWRAILVLEMIQRLFGRNRENRLERLKKTLAARREEIDALEREIAEQENCLAEVTSSSAPAECPWFASGRESCLEGRPQNEMTA